VVQSEVLTGTGMEGLWKITRPELDQLDALISQIYFGMRLYTFLCPSPTPTCWRCFNVNFNVNFKIVFKTIQLCISW
jgi:hypothetical protein